MTGVLLVLLFLLLVAIIGITILGYTVVITINKNSISTGPAGEQGATGAAAQNVTLPSFTSQVLVTSAINGSALTDTGLLNPMGILYDEVASTGPSDVIWTVVNGVSLDGSTIGPSTLKRFAYQYSLSTGPSMSLLTTVSVTGPNSPALTDAVFNFNQTGYVMRGRNGQTGSASIICVDQRGVIYGYNSSIDSLIVPILNNNGSAIYYGVEMLNGILYATNFTSAHVEMYTPNMTLLGTFTDPNDSLISNGFSPFSIHTTNGILLIGFVFNDNGLPLNSNGNAYVNIYAPLGAFQQRFQNFGYMNIPFGFVAIPPQKSVSGLEEFVASYNGNGFIQRFNAINANNLGLLKDPFQDVLTITEIWDLFFPPLANSIPGAPLQMLASAGTDLQQQGLIWSIIKA